jgi:acyl carrier protein
MSIEQISSEQQQKTMVAETIKRAIIDEARVNITPQQLADDELLNGTLLRITSLSFVGMLMTLEDELDIKLEDELFMQMKFTHVSDLINFVYPTYVTAHAGKAI